MVELLHQIFIKRNLDNHFSLFLFHKNDNYKIYIVIYITFSDLRD